MIKTMVEDDVPKSKIKRFIKEEWKYSFKRGSSRPTKSIQDYTVVSKSIFWSKLLLQIYRRKIIINIDEWGFNKSVKQHYSWLPRGVGNSILNDNYKGSCNLILAILNTGEWVGWLKDKTTRAFDYLLFLKVLVDILEENGINNKQDVIIVQDNAVIHHSKIIKSFVRKEGLVVYFLPPYSAELAPVELVFGWIKKKMKTNYHAAALNFGAKNGKDAIVETMQHILVETVQKVWMKVMKEWKKCIVEQYVRANALKLD
jgi:hypothetical protein